MVGPVVPGEVTGPESGPAAAVPGVAVCDPVAPGADVTAVVELPTGASPSSVS